MVTQTMLSSIYILSTISLVFISTVESTYNVFTYTDGISADEHCCLVQLGEDFCLAKPLTRSLIQVNKECQRVDVDKKHKNQLNKVVRRLNVETTKKLTDKILIELKAPLDKDILQDDLLCLASANNNINLEKCYVILANVEQKKHKRKSKNGTEEEPVVEEKPADENKIHRIKVSEPIRIHKGHGLAVHQTYELDLTHSPTTHHHHENEYWSWYRTHTKDICSQPYKYAKTCISLTNDRVKYLRKIIKKKSNDDDDDDEQPSSSTISIKKGSKLYCEDNNEQTKLLGYYRNSEVCFQTNNQIYVEHKFTDYVSLSDINKNRDVLKFISNNTKLTNEFEKDCNDKITLADIKKSLEQEAEAIESDDKSPQNETQAAESDDEPST